MNIKPALTAALCLSAVVLLYQHHSDAPQHPLHTQTPPSSPEIAAAAVGILPNEQSATVAAGNEATEIVMGLRVRKDRNCRVELKDYVTPDGEMFSAYSCTSTTPATPHHYAEYNNETLAGMSYADADAAALLGQRLIASDTGKSYELLIRASALDGGNLEHIAWLSDQAFSAVEIDGEPHIENLQRRYELAALAARLGGGPELSDTLRSQLSSLGIEPSQLQQLDATADALLKTMLHIQQQVIGESTLGGQGDA